MSTCICIASLCTRALYKYGHRSTYYSIQIMKTIADTGSLVDPWVGRGSGRIGKSSLVCISGLIDTRKSRYLYSYSLKFYSTNISSDVKKRKDIPIERSLDQSSVTGKC